MDASLRSGWPRTFAALFAIAAAARSADFAWRVARARRGARGAHAFERTLPHAARRVLIVGDSTAVGLGAVEPAATIAGRIAAEFPQAEVVNRAVLGARVDDVTAQLASAGDGFDVVLIAAGGNDVIRGTPPGTLAFALARAIGRARRHGARVVVANSANVGAAPLFFWPLGPLFTRRSLRVRAVFARVCRAQRACFVNFTWTTRRDPFRRDRARYFAADGLHPTADAYAHCFAVLKRRALARALA
jgi:lysophospholipase L1-like esterase